MPEHGEIGIFIKGARVHNLKNIDLQIARDHLIVVTGVSGSGKSSLAFDTLYAEGQRRYVESLSAYARQFLGRIDKPDVDFINGIPPAVAIEQKVNTRNPRSTVGTSTEIYDYLKLLYSRIGKTISPISGKEVKRHNVTDVVNFILSNNKGTKLVILSPKKIHQDKSIDYQLDLFAQQGMTRALFQNQLVQLSDLNVKEDLSSLNEIDLVVDRVVSSNKNENRSRLGDSIQTAFQVGKGHCSVWNPEYKLRSDFSNRFELDGMTFEEPSEHLFSFNNPLGACPICEGYGMVIGIDEDLVVPRKDLSVYDDAIVCWKGEKMKRWKERLIMNADKFRFPVHKPYYELTDEQKNILWRGNRYFKGLDAFFRHLEKKKYKIQYRVMLSRYRGKTTCYECRGTRLRKEADYVKVGNKSISQLVQLPISELVHYFSTLFLDNFDQEVAGRLLHEIQSRLDFLMNVGLGYLTLNRLSSTLSGGESQRINLATSLGSSLVGALYILDEPSIGLHSRDTNRLINVLKNLTGLGNTVLVVEHDEKIIRSADIVIDMGPHAGRNGGEVIYHGASNSMDSSTPGLTAAYLSGSKRISIPAERRKWNNFIEVIGARENNLKGINVKIPLNVFTVIAGVSGSGKSSLISQILYPAMKKSLHGSGDKPGKYDIIEGDLHLLDRIEFVDQNPIGKSSRSNPVTYLKAFDEIRSLFANQSGSKARGFKPAHFSFNVDGGRCDDCKGEGEIKVEMQFMADVHLVCETCKGKRFKDEILQVKYRNKNIHDILEMTVNEAIDFFNQAKPLINERIVKRLKPLQDVGLGYVKLGQSSSTLSGGESQRVKLAYFLSKESEREKVMFVFDEPTTGLHFHDISMLLDAFFALIRNGHTVIVIEHNLEVVKSADWIIELGPEGGENGGFVVFEGVPEYLIEKQTYTSKYLIEKMSD